jgi:peptidoglycan hydrolase-like amidase
MRKLLFTLVIGLTNPLAAEVTAAGQKVLDELRERYHSPTVRVQLMSDAEGSQVEVKGTYNVFDPRTGKKLDSAYSSSSYYMYPTVDGIKWGQEFPGIYQVLIVPDKVDSTMLVNGTEYRGMAYMYQMKGSLGGVNELSLEDFVASILSTHVPAEITEKEALAALAIALRTEALYWLAQSSNPYWDVKAGTVGYRGAALERHDAPFEEALKISKDLVMKRMGTNELVSVRWFSAGETMAPVNEMQNLAKEGKDARAILERLFGEMQIVKTTHFKNEQK